MLKSVLKCVSVQRIVQPPRYNAVMLRNMRQMKSQVLVNAMSEADLFSPLLCNNLLKQRVEQRTGRSQRGLYHAKRTGRKLQTCFSEKKKLKIPMTNHAVRKMRLLGGIDNYILLTDPKHLDSIYGEYLRRLMLNKLKDPNYRLPYIVKSQSQKLVRKKQKLRDRRPTILYTKETRYTDLTQDRLRLPHQLNRKEYEDYKQLENARLKQEDVDIHNPIVNRAKQQLLDQIEEMTPLAEQVKQHHYNTFMYKHPKLKNALREQFNASLNEIQNPTSKLTPQKKAKKTKYKNVKKKREIAKSKVKNKK